MGKLTLEINGQFNGKVGPLVGYMWKRTPCIRTYHRTINYPNTASQQKERDWFVTMVRFAAQARKALILGLKKQADEAGMTEGNYFVTKNKQYFQHGTEDIVVDYARLQIAAGPAADVVFHTPVFRDHETISIDFDKNTLFSRASGDDKVYVYVYSPDTKKGMLLAAVERRDKNISFRLPENWSGFMVHIYGFVIDREGRPSNSTYIGAGRLDHYSEGGNYIPLNKSWMDFIEMANRVNLDADGNTIESKNTDNSVDTAALTTPPGNAAPPE